MGSRTVYGYFIRISVITVAILVMAASNVFSQGFTGMVSPENDAGKFGNTESVNSPFISEPMVNIRPDEIVSEKIAPNIEEIRRLENLPGELSRYSLGIGDVVEVRVMRHPEVSGQYVINKEGKIQYDFVGDVVIEGLTKDEAKDKIAELLSTYIISPEVTVMIVGYNSKVVYVVGEVGAPGKIYMRGDTITVREALMEARLPQLTGSARKSKLITPAENGKAEQKKVDVYALLYEGDLRENLVMKPGDTLYIPATFLTKTMRIINPITQPIQSSASTGRTVMTGF